MKLLMVFLPERARAGVPDGPAAGLADAPVRWVLSPDGRQTGQAGSCRLAELPQAQRLVAVCPPRELAWHRVTVPRAPAAKLQAALASVLEERLLDDPALVHIALAADARPGQVAWVAVLHRPWLLDWLQAFGVAGRRLDALVPLLSPRRRPAVHVFDPGPPLHGDSAPALGPAPAPAWALAMSKDEALCLPLSGLGAAERLVHWRTAPEVRLSASPALQGQATRYFRRRVRAVDDSRVALAAARRSWQLLQFELAPRAGAVRLAGRWRSAVQTPAWRPVLWGLLVLLLANALGLNLYAWRTEAAIQDRRAAMAQLLRDSHPGVRAVLDAPVQMRRETELLRQGSAPLPGTDLASLLRLMAQAWPAGVPAPPAWHYQRERLNLAESALQPEQAQALRQQLAGTGWSVELVEGQWAVRPPLAATLNLEARP